MKFIQTFYFNKSINPFKHGFGWASPAYHLIGWALSCLQLKLLFGNVSLYCNSTAASFLKDELGLPYDNFYITHDNLDLVNEKLWAVPKVFTYSLQEEPFIHFDGDVFLFDHLPVSLLDSGLIAQNTEEATGYYLSTQKELMRHFVYFPDCVKKDFNSPVPIKAVNAGIIGGNNIPFIREYTASAFDYINRNVQQLSKINADRFNVFFEQHLFYSLAKEKDLSINFLIPGTVMDNQYQFLGDFHEVACKKNYLHLLGQYKKDEFTCRQMAFKLRQLYPEYYYRIISLCSRKSTPLSTGLYTNKKMNTPADYLEFNNRSEKYFSALSFADDIPALSNTGMTALKENETNTLCLLKEAIQETSIHGNANKEDLENDLINFTTNIRNIVEIRRRVPDEYLYGRDLDSVTWYCEVFGNDTEIPNQLINKSAGLNIIKSEFDWAGLYNKYKRVGVYYYEKLELRPGEFYNMIVPEIYSDGFSLHDLDEMEKTILDCLDKPTAIKDLFVQMYNYAEEDIIINHLNEYEHLIIVLLKQLTIKKAIQPFRNSISQPIE